MSITYPFIPFPQALNEKVFQDNLTKLQLKTLWGITDETTKFEEARSSFTRELSCRYLAKKLNIRYDCISRVYNQLAKKGYISIRKSTNENEGSFITLLINNQKLCTPPINHETCTPSPDVKHKSCTPPVHKTCTAHDLSTPVNNGSNIEENLPVHNSWGVHDLCTNQELNIRKDIKNQICPPMISSPLPSPSPDDDVTAMDKREEEKTDIEKILKAIEEWEQEEEPLNHSSNCLPPAAVNQSSSKQNPINPLSSSIPANFINTVDNYNVNKDIDIKPVPPAPTAPVTIQGNPLASSRVQAPTAPVSQVRGNSPADKKDKEFSPLGDILPGSFKLDTSKYSATVPIVPGVSPAVMVKSKEILIKKNLTEKEINIVFDRIAGIVKTNQDIKNKDGYFLACCNSEQEREVIPEKSLDEQDKIIEAIQKGYEEGKIKYVLSNEGERKEIIEMNKNHFIYWNGRQPQGMDFKKLKERHPHLLDMRFFVGD